MGKLVGILESWKYIEEFYESDFGLERKGAEKEKLFFLSLT